MTQSDTAVTLRSFLSTWPGRIYFGLLCGLVVGLVQMTRYAAQDTTSAWLSVSILGLLAGIVAISYTFSRDQLMWVLTSNITIAGGAFATYFVWALVTGVSTADGIMTTPGLRNVFSALAALITAEIAVVLAFLLVVATKGFGGDDGDPPEKQVLGDDLDL